MNAKFKKYVCKVPFELLEIHSDSHWLCCPSWLETPIGKNPENINDLSFVSSWTSEQATQVRKSVFEGNYKFCSVEKCPTLNTLAHTDIVPDQFIEKSKFTEHTGIHTSDDIVAKTPPPRKVALNFDRSCNLKCPSCRKGLIKFDIPGSAEYDKNQHMLGVLRSELGEYITSIFMSGSGEALYSKSQRSFLVNLNEDEFPNLHHINLITNAQLLNKTLWESMNASKHITSLNISVDAGTKHTYENVVRLGGSWDRLIENLKFISEIPTLSTVDLCMVVSALNYHEMETFYNLMCSIFENAKYNIKITFMQHVFWEEGLYSAEDYKAINIFDIHHKDHCLLLTEIEKINNKPYVIHNFNHLMEVTDEK